jgi:cation-dependent mannose-6-phosphate receptor
MALQSRGRKLVLQYTGGSPCGNQKTKRDPVASVRDGAAYKYHDYSDDDEVLTRKDDDDSQKKPSQDEDKDKDNDKGKKKEEEKGKAAERKKSTIISFLCDRDQTPQATVSFVGTDPEECAYFFEVRSQHACASAEPHQPGSVGPGSVFTIILIIAVLVYFGGGVFYQRTVTHARGWRQLPNYSLWSSIWNFLRVRSRLTPPSPNRIRG